MQGSVRGAASNDRPYRVCSNLSESGPKVKLGRLSEMIVGFRQKPLPAAISTLFVIEIV